MHISKRECVGLSEKHQLWCLTLFMGNPSAVLCIQLLLNDVLYINYTQSTLDAGLLNLNQRTTSKSHKIHSSVPSMQKYFQFPHLSSRLRSPCQECIYLIIFTYTLIGSRQFECQLITLMGLICQCLPSCCTNKCGAVMTHNLMTYLLQ